MEKQREPNLKERVLAYERKKQAEAAAHKSAEGTAITDNLLAAVSEATKQDAKSKHDTNSPQSAFALLLQVIEEHTGISVDDVQVDPYDIYEMRRNEVAEVSAQIKQRQEAYYKQFMEDMRKDAMIDPQCTFAKLKHDINNKDAFAASQNFISNIDKQLSKQLLLVFGDRGAGKTSLCHAIANQYLQLKTNAYYQTMRNKQLPLVLITSFDDIKKTWLFLHRETYEEKQDRESRFQTFCDVDLLIIDGLCNDNMALEAFSQKVLSELLRLRANRELPVVITTSINLQAIHRAIGDQCYEGIKSFDVLATALLGGSRRPNILFNGAYLP